MYRYEKHELGLDYLMDFSIWYLSKIYFRLSHCCVTGEACDWGCSYYGAIVDGQCCKAFFVDIACHLFV